MTGSHPSRAERRQATEARILDAARRLFAEHGFDRTTIRAVATSAGVDPALVMQYFGSKRGLFARALEVVVEPPSGDGAEELIDQLLGGLGTKLGDLPDGTLATMRSMLTDPAAAEHARGTLGGQIGALSDALAGADDPGLRAALAITTIVGATIGYQILGLTELRGAPPERVAELLRPALRALTEPESERQR
ncbi:MAG TPA: TetR family transcriptional regulator [Streptosporangiaceae bacterium]|jgi:AcrR family transcriptional regulator